MKVPAVQVPTVKVPAVQVPAVQVPAVRAPAVQVPTVKVPAAQGPAVTLPAVQVPSVSAPPVSVPSVSLPPVSVPAVSLPAVRVPPVALPPVALGPVALPVLTPTTPLAQAVPLLAPADVLAGVTQTPALPAALPLFGPPTGDQGVLRVAHLSPSTGAVDMYVEGPGLPLTRVASDVTYRTLSSYLAATPGVYTLQARPAGAAPSTPPALTASVAVGPRSAQTAAFVDVGPGSTPQAEVLDDGTTPAPPGKALVRVVSAAAGVGPVDVVARGGGPLAQGLFYGSGSSYTQVDAKTWTMDVRTNNGETAVATVPVPSTAVATVVVARDARGALAVTAVPDAASAFPAAPAPGPAGPPAAPSVPATPPAPAAPSAPATTSTTPAPTTSSPAPRPGPATTPKKLPRGGVPAGFGGMAAEESRLVPVQVHAAPAAPAPVAAAAPVPAAAPALTSALDAAPGPSLVPLTQRLAQPAAPALVPLAARPAAAAPAPVAAAPALVPLAPRPAAAPAALVPLSPRPAVAPAPLAPAAPITAARPAGLVVPAAGIDAGGVGTLGLDEIGELQAPATPNDVGWYRDGATPGDPGTAVLVGHVDSYRGPGVFWHLRNLRPGDTIDVPRSDGTVAHFGVDAVETVDKDAFPTERVYAPTAGPSLRLITCGGPFDRSARSYEDNVVVFASPR